MVEVAERTRVAVRGYWKSQCAERWSWLTRWPLSFMSSPPRHACCTSVCELAHRLRGLFGRSLCLGESLRP
jgi:hypothetical protein